MRFTVPIRLPSLANQRVHWRWAVKCKRHQKEQTALAMLSVRDRLPTPPVVVIITRSGPRALDDDNLAGACKYVRDEVARAVGLDDGSPLYTWICQQRVGSYGVEVEIVERADHDQFRSGELHHADE